MQQDDNVQTIVPFLDKEVCNRYIEENKLKVHDKPFVDHCMQIFMDQCKYDATAFKATSLKVIKKDHPHPLVVIDDPTILVIYNKKILMQRTTKHQLKQP